MVTVVAVAASDTANLVAAKTALTTAQANAASLIAAIHTAQAALDAARQTVIQAAIASQLLPPGAVTFSDDHKFMVSQ